MLFGRMLYSTPTAKLQALEMGKSPAISTQSSWREDITEEHRKVRRGGKAYGFCSDWSRHGAIACGTRYVSDIG